MIKGGSSHVDDLAVIITLADCDEMSEEDCRRHELADGVLVEMPPRYPVHQRAVRLLADQLEDQLPVELDVVHAFDVLLKDSARPLMRKPDVVVASSKLFDAGVTRFDAADVALVIEILSEGSEDVDLRVKPREYAAAGIPDYWVVALDEPVSMVAHSLVDGRYELAGGGSRMLDVRSPAPMTVDLAALVRRRLME
ncbi:Uma2 family endonuclease [Lentzea chajnantorensis]